MKASKSGYLAILKYLIYNLADVNNKDKYNKINLMKSFKKENKKKTILSEFFYSLSIQGKKIDMISIWP